MGERTPIEIDGAHGSGSGTLVRFAVAFSALLGRPLRVVRARARRDRPGLRPQHAAAIHAAAALCGGSAAGAEVGASEFSFTPGPAIRGGEYAFDIGTAGSATMLALGLLPIACFADGPCVARITGGVFQDFAPSPHHLQHVLAPLVTRMGPRVELRVLRAGYVPRGAGVVELRVDPAPAALAPLRLAAPGVAGTVRGIAFSSHLDARAVSERMAQSCEERLGAAGLTSAIERILDDAALHAGASLAVWTATSEGGLLGADRAGAPRRSSEAIGRFVADALLADLRAGASMDRHAADQLVPFAALAEGESSWIAPRATEHLATNLWLAERFGARVERDARAVRVAGVARAPGPAPSA